MSIQFWARKRARVVALVVACALSVVGAVQAEPPRTDSPYDARQKSLAESVIKHGKSPEAAIDLLRMTRSADEVDPELSLALFRRIADTASVGVEHRVYAKRRVAWDARRTGDVGGSQTAFDALGYVRRFRVIGPFDNEGKRGFDTALGPEAQTGQAVNLEATYQGRERLVRWRELPEIVQGGYVSFDAVFRPTENVCGLAETTLVVDRARPVTLWIGGGGATKLYFNGREVMRDVSYRAPHPDRSVVRVDARAGENRVLVKTCVTGGTWGFYLRTGDDKGEPLALKADPLAVGAVPLSADKPAPKANGPKSVFAQLEAAAAGDKPKAAALEQLARYLWYTGSDDPAERRARQLGERAAELEPTAPRYLLASVLAEERYEKLRYVERAEKLAPNDPEVRFARAQLVSTGPGGERALRELDAISEGSVAAMEGHELRATLLRSLGLGDSALAEVRHAASLAPRSTAWLGRLADFLSVEPRQDEALELQKKILALRQDHVSARKALIEDAVAQKREGEVLDHLEMLHALFPADEKRSIYISEVYDALGREDMKLKSLRAALDVAPESALLHVRLGRALLRSGHTDEAAQSLRRALALKPQDAETRELLEQLVPEVRRDESFAVDAETLLKRRSDRKDYSVTVLQDLTVNTVFDNGLGSRFVQFSAQVHDQEGARRLRARSIQFDPDTQRVDVRLARVYRADGSVADSSESYEQQLGEPWYRVYYDTRALVVVFPNLEPGDSVELRYRIDDVAPRNLFADYFGDLNMLQGAEPQAHVEYVLLTPAARRFYFNQPKLEGLKHEEKLEGERRIHRYWADDVPAIRMEPGMPGATEIVPYLHVSTYETWKDVGRWYWGLIHDQLYADTALKNIVKDLKKDAKDERQLVERIYGWAVKNTRYVALEFGIHGFLPYRVPEIVRRGFGDCKDKASLIYTMLREAGVDARIVLVRTRRNGALHDLPASLAAFDHAIAYVPSLDLYLDGTAEHSGTRELPGGDQGVMVLLVGPESAELRKTPVLPASANVRARKVTIELAADGMAKVKTDETISGDDAARYRDTYQAEGTRKERLERQLSAAYAGLTLEKSAITGLDDIERDVELTYELSAPQVARREGDELRIAATSLRDLLRELAPTPSRKYALDLGTKSTFREERTVRAPSGFRVALVPPGGVVKSRFGSLSVQNEQRGSEVVSRSELVLDVDRVEAADYPEFRRFIEQADDVLRQRTAFAPEKR